MYFLIKKEGNLREKKKKNDKETRMWDSQTLRLTESNIRRDEKEDKRIEHKLARKHKSSLKGENHKGRYVARY